MAGWNTPARNAAINKRLGDQMARRSIFPVSRSRHPDARFGSGVDDFSCPPWWQRFPKAAVRAPSTVRSEFGGGTGELCYLDGAFIPFAKTKAEREATKDPRPSLAERYRDNADYSERVKAAATALEGDGYLLPEDTKRIVEHAAKLTW
jgi:hypothetical protein